MAKDSTTKHIIWAMVAIVIVIATVFVYLFSTLNHVATQSNAGTVTSSWSALLTAQYTNNKNSPPVNVTVVTNYYLYPKGSTQLIASGNTVTNGISLTGLNANSCYTAVLGDNTNYLPVAANFCTPATNTTTYVKVQVINYTRPTVYASNTGSVTPSATVNTVIDNVPVNTVSVQNSALFLFKASGQSSGNTQGDLAVFPFNSGQINSYVLTLPTAASQGLTVPTPVYATGQNTYAAYVIPQQNFYSSVSYSPVVTMASTFNANTAQGGAPVGFYAYPITSYLYNGQLQTNVVVQPGTSGTAIITSNSITNLIEYSSN
jgi:hypothetical protein